MTVPGSAGQWDSAYHAPVLAGETLALLDGARRVLDGTLGGGGHSEALLERGTTVTGIDRDPEAIAMARSRLAAYERSGQFRAFLGNYANLDMIAALDGERFDG